MFSVIHTIPIETGPFSQFNTVLTSGNLTGCNPTGPTFHKKFASQSINQYGLSIDLHAQNLVNELVDYDGSRFGVVNYDPEATCDDGSCICELCAVEFMSPIYGTVICRKVDCYDVDPNLSAYSLCDLFNTTGPNGEPNYYYGDVGTTDHDPYTYPQYYHSGHLLDDGSGTVPHPLYGEPIMGRVYEVANLQNQCDSIPGCKPAPVDEEVWALWSHCIGPQAGINAVHDGQGCMKNVAISELPHHGVGGLPLSGPAVAQAQSQAYINASGQTTVDFVDKLSANRVLNGKGPLEIGDCYEYNLYAASYAVSGPAGINIYDPTTTTSSFVRSSECFCYLGKFKENELPGNIGVSWENQHLKYMFEYSPADQATLTGDNYGPNCAYPSGCNLAGVYPDENGNAQVGSQFYSSYAVEVFGGCGGGGTSFAQCSGYIDRYDVQTGAQITVQAGDCDPGCFQEHPFANAASNLNFCYTDPVNTLGP